MIGHIRHRLNAGGHFTRGEVLGTLACDRAVRGGALRAFVVALVAAVLIVAPATSRADERSAPQLMEDRLLSAPQPWRDPLDLAVRLRGIPPATPLIQPFAPAPLAAGYTEKFWILDQRTAQLFQAAAVLRLATAHAYWFVASDMSERVSQTDLQRSAGVFETNTYPLIHHYFGSEPTPGVDRDGHIFFLLGNVPGVAAYFSSVDAYPRAVNPRSNQHDMIYVNLNTLRPGQAAFDSTMTHEFQHMTNFAHCPSQEGWVDEGASELAMRIAGYDGPPPLAFASHPDVQLTAWSNQAAEQTRHYQASYLFLRYVAERAGGWSALPDLLQTCARGEAIFSAFLARNPIDPDVESLFSDWTVANVLQDPSVADGRYGYAGGGFHAALTGAATADAPFLGSVPQYAANYVELPIGAANVTFSGDSAIPLLSASIDASGAWWSNRGDNVDTRMTRTLDLSGVDSATLRFGAWYDVEDHFDFVYLSASRDSGLTWQVLRGAHTTADRSTGNNFGEGWTGSTGADWINEEVDLTPFAGSTTLLRFEYVTDQSYNGEGFAFRHMQIPQLGLDEPGAVEGSWSTDGWVRVDGPIPERWNLRLLRWGPAGVSVEPVSVEADGTATIALDDASVRNLLVVAPTAPRTLVPANYSVSVSP